ncbi:MAG TPA: U32 family peptidase, partial [Bacillota bacterium]|nr:U32 family peptidase [Bacillota bacterium]
MRLPELLAPAGDLEKLKVAVAYGADAVYLGGREFGLRAFAGNFSLEEIKEGVAYAHGKGARVYVTLNIFPHNQDLVGLPEYVKSLEAIGVDAVIVSDPGVFAIVRQTSPQLPIHLSTQANTTNWAAAQFWLDQGVERIILARELSLTEIREIKDRTAGELEVFAHGAMCISYSGRCLLSNYMAGRDSNRGQCAQACRWSYGLVEEKRPGQYFPIEEDDRGTYVFNSQDLCLIEHLPQLLATGVSSLKIEGRMKSVHYVATVIRVYRAALDAYGRDQAGYEFNPEWLEDIAKVSHREYTTGFFLDKAEEKKENYLSSAYVRNCDFIGLFRSYDPVTGIALVEQRNRFSRGEQVEIVGPGGHCFTQTLGELKDAEGQPIEVAPHPQQ